MEWAAQGPPESGKVFMPSQKPGVQENVLVVSQSRAYFQEVWLLHAAECFVRKLRLLSPWRLFETSSVKCRERAGPSSQ